MRAELRQGRAGGRRWVGVMSWSCQVPSDGVVDAGAVRGHRGSTRTAPLLEVTSTWRDEAGSVGTCTSSSPDPLWARTRYGPPPTGSLTMTAPLALVAVTCSGGRAKSRVVPPDATRATKSVSPSRVPVMDPELELISTEPLTSSSWVAPLDVSTWSLSTVSPYTSTRAVPAATSMT